MSEIQLLLAPVADVEVELVDGELVTSVAPAAPSVVLSPSPPPVPPALDERNLFAEAERIAARAATASTGANTPRSSAPAGTGSPQRSAARPWPAISTPT